jgi:2-oxoglutarate ferredoxin oxidoreductase subunit alpha
MFADLGTTESAPDLFMARVSVRIAGANGEGIESSGALLMDAAAKSGLHVFGHRGYQSVIRGGHVWYQVRLGDSALRSYGEGIDILVALNQDAVTYQKSRLNENAIIIYDPSKTNVSDIDSSKYRLAGIPMLDIAMEASGDPIMRNIVAIGAVLRLVGIGIDKFGETVKKRFGKKGEKVVEGNMKAATSGYNYKGVGTVHKLAMDSVQRYVLDGNTAVALGAYAAGCKFYAAYPMTPATGVLHWFAAHESKGVMFKQTEDEIAAINMAVGASFAGVRAMCGTSGGGFALMVEALGMAGMIEAPIVVVESQRTGPSTGLPTKSGQADLLFAMHASHGEFPRIVVAPSSVADCFRISAEAFNLAERYQVPVLILLDQYLSEHMESVDNFDIDGIKMDRGRIVTASDGRFKRYEFAEDGVSPRAFPGTKGLMHIANSDEHDEYGDDRSDLLVGYDESIALRKRMHDKRMKKTESMLKKESAFVPKIMNENAEHFLVAFGSVAQAAVEAVEMLKSEGRSFGVISFDYIMPLDAERTKHMLEGKRLFNVEENYTGQLAQVIMTETGIGMQGSILKYDGEPFTGAEIARRALDLIR